MQQVQLFARKTFKYVDGWSHEDRWDYLTTLKLTPPRVTTEGNDYDVGPTYVQFARLPAGADSKAIARALEQTMRGSRCRHEYDCCGCASRRVFTKLVGPRKLLVHSSISYNY